MEALALKQAQLRGRGEETTGVRSTSDPQGRVSVLDMNEQVGLRLRRSGISINRQINNHYPTEPRGKQRVVAMVTPLLLAQHNNVRLRFVVI